MVLNEPIMTHVSLKSKHHSQMLNKLCESPQGNMTWPQVLIPLFPQRNTFYYDQYDLHVQANQVQLCTLYNIFVIFLACLSMFITFFQWGLMRNCCDPVTLCLGLARLQPGQRGIFLCFGLKPTLWPCCGLPVWMQPLDAFTSINMLTNQKTP